MQPDFTGVVLGGKYRLTRSIGAGAMGYVWEAEHVQLGRMVAVKLLRLDLVSDPAALARFQQEASAAGRVGSPHIVDVLDVGATPGGAPFIVMEMLRGCALSSLLAERPVLPVPRAVGMARQILAGLTVAHAAGIVHRDLKPDNILLEEQGDGRDHLKIVDFGVAKAKNDPKAAHLTRTGMILGTPRYMAPEQAMGLRDVDQRADVWAVGVILYECLTGRVPHEAPTLAGTLGKILSEAAAPPGSLRPGIEPWLDAVVMRALAKDPAQRFPTAAAFSGALGPDPEAARFAGVAAAAPAAPPPSRPAASAPVGQMATVRDPAAAAAAGRAVQPPSVAAAPAPVPAAAAVRPPPGAGAALARSRKGALAAAAAVVVVAAATLAYLVAGRSGDDGAAAVDAAPAEAASAPDALAAAPDGLVPPGPAASADAPGAVTPAVATEEEEAALYAAATSEIGCRMVEYQATHGRTPGGGDYVRLRDAALAAHGLDLERFAGLFARFGSREDLVEQSTREVTACTYRRFGLGPPPGSADAAAAAARSPDEERRLYAETAAEIGCVFARAAAAGASDGGDNTIEATTRILSSHGLTFAEYGALGERYGSEREVQQAMQQRMMECLSADAGTPDPQAQDEAAARGVFVAVVADTRCLPVTLSRELGRPLTDEESRGILDRALAKNGIDMRQYGALSARFAEDPAAVEGIRARIGECTASRD